MNLRTIPDMADRFEVPVGLSDHSMAAEVSIAAVALGACILEKHFTLSRSIKGPDSSFSLEPDELKDIIMALRVTEQALGKVNYHNTEQEEACKIFRKSLFVVKDVKKGDAFTEENVRSIRPGHGLHPRFFEKILTCRATEDIKRGTPLSEKLLLEME
jgi:N-acetylneuraminate synthase